MKRSGKSTATKRVIALALTWDGARWPVRTLPPKARAFLRAGSSPASASSIPSAAEMAKFFAEDHIQEIRICWVPRLKGGVSALSTPFLAPTGKRITFRNARATRFGDFLGVVYRRST
jgi:hypothetical protein